MKTENATGFFFIREPGKSVGRYTRYTVECMWITIIHPDLAMETVDGNVQIVQRHIEELQILRKEHM